MVLTVYHYGEVLDRPAHLRSLIRDFCVAFSTVRGFPNSVRRRFGSGCAYARVDLNFSLTVLPLCGRCCASVLLCLRLVPELKCLHSNVYYAKCLFLC